MTVVDRLTDQHFREHEARLKHIDELLERASQSKKDLTEFDDELNEIRTERAELLNHLNSLKKQSQDEWQTDGIENAGPMIIWDAVAKKLEKLIERIER